MWIFCILCIYSLANAHLGYSQREGIMNDVAYKYLYTSFCMNIFSILLGTHLGVELLALPPFPSQLGKLCTRYASTAVGCGQLESSTLLWQPTTQPGVAAGRSLANENDDSSPRSSTCQTFTLHRAGQVSCFAHILQMM